jgi:HSP20 family molecular chaperone IbpA
MHRTTYELMNDHLRAVFRALTGTDPPVEAEGGAPAESLSPEAVARRFADLEVMARRLSIVAERVPPFAFAPPVDVIDEDKEILVEAAIPGVERDDLEIELHDDTLVLAGVRRGARATNGRTYLYAEIPRGPFRRVLRLPQAVSSEHRIEVERGLVRIWCRKASGGGLHA